MLLLWNELLSPKQLNYTIHRGGVKPKPTKIDIEDEEAYSCDVNSTVSSAISNSIRQVAEETGFQDYSVSDDGEMNLPYNISISIGIAGQVQGFLFFRANRKDALSLAHYLGTLMGVDLDGNGDLTSMHKAALSELANQISGRITILLSNIGIDTDITPPTILTGDSISFGISDDLQFHGFILSVPSRGTIHILAGLRVVEH